MELSQSKGQTEEVVEILEVYKVKIFNNKGKR